MNKVPMTVVGADQLRKELEILKFDRRPKITEAIASARELGDCAVNLDALHRGFTATNKACHA